MSPILTQSKRLSRTPKLAKEDKPLTLAGHGLRAQAGKGPQGLSPKPPPTVETSRPRLSQPPAFSGLQGRREDPADTHVPLHACTWARARAHIPNSSRGLCTQVCPSTPRSHSNSLQQRPAPPTHTPSSQPLGGPRPPARKAPSPAQTPPSPSSRWPQSSPAGLCCHLVAT